MKKIVILFLVVCANLFSARDPFKLQCWDGTFSYDAFSIAEVDNGIEFSINGHFFHLEGFEFGYPPWEGFIAADLLLHLKFDRSQCSSLLSNNIYCDAAGNFTEPFKVFIENSAYDLGNRIEVITDIDTYGAKLTFNGSTLNLELVDPYKEGTDEAVKTINIINVRHCGQTQQFAPTFPQRLRDYLNNEELMLRTI